MNLIDPQPPPARYLRLVGTAVCRPLPLTGRATTFAAHEAPAAASPPPARFGLVGALREGLREWRAWDELDRLDAPQLADFGMTRAEVTAGRPRSLTLFLIGKTAAAWTRSRS